MKARDLRFVPLLLLASIVARPNCLGEEILLWPDDSQKARNSGPEQESPKLERIVVRDTPSMVVMLPPEDKRSGAGVVICAGGGYSILAFEKESLEIGRWMNERGIAAFCLKYRCGGEPNTHPVPLNDGLRAMRLVRSRAKAWGLETDRIGVMGFSAGGHLAASVSTLSDNGD